MERYKKKDMLQAVDTLLKANDAIVKTVRSNPQGAAEALVQCQESAIALGTYIDTLGEKYTGLVRVLEDYCENIFQMSENLPDENLCRKESKKIQKQLTGLQNSIKYDLPEDRKEVVFLPYKASMWDSLESVWKAADADENTDAYVIPIPYFDKNPDGSFKEEHYEGDQYPKYVPIIRYDAYDLEARRPDIIYIHNPYDECNHVTSVHPYFYAKNLKNFTDKLVYIPYFILGEIEPDNQAAIEGMKHFCFMPGTLYADQVIVQSENMRQIYINEYIKAAKEMGLSGEHVDRKFLEKKFLGTGSPKIDKLLNTRKEDLEIPAEWLRIIEKPDGSWKKIVFYNTSVSALLQHSEKMLRKMESVFGIFKENQDEVALLWRPHPLIQATIESMRPQLWEGYQEIRDRYVEEGWGIYDDSADLDRAVVISDAYYGDGSSVVGLCQKARKRLMIQEVALSEYTAKLDIADAVIVDNEIWFYPFNKLCVADKKGKVKKYYDIPYSKESATLAGFSCLAEWNRKICLVPYLENKIFLFEIDQEQFTTINIRQDLILGEKGMFIGARSYGQYLFMFGATIPMIVRLNMMDNSMIYIYDWVAKIHAMGYREKENFFERSNLILGSKIYVPFYNINAVLELDCETLETVIHKIGIENEGYIGICYSDKSIWLLPKNKYHLVKWNVNTDKFQEIGIASCCDSNRVYLGIVSQQNNKLLLPRQNEMPVFRNEEENIFELEGSYSFFHEDEERLIFHENISNVLSVYYKEKNMIDKREIEFDFNLLEPQKIICNETNILSEQRGMNIQHLIQFLIGEK